MLKFGFHASTGGNLVEVPFRVKEMGGECFQFFSRSPHGGSVKPISEEDANLFKENCKKAGIENCYIHTPYFINLSSLDNRIYYGSIKAIKDDLERSKKLGAKYVVTHIGSAKDFVNSSSLFDSGKTDFSKIQTVSQEEIKKLSQEKNIPQGAILRVIEALQKICGEEKGVSLIIEIAAGAGSIMGSSLEEINLYLKAVPSVSGFCFDTAHAFASGYNFLSEKERKSTFNFIEKEMGRAKLKLIHLNDSMGGLGEKKDRHAHLGEGLIGKDFFVWLVDYFSKGNYNVDMILETPTGEGVGRDLELLKGYRDQQ